MPQRASSRSGPSARGNSRACRVRLPRPPAACQSHIMSCLGRPACKRSVMPLPSGHLGLLNTHQMTPQAWRR